MAMEALRSLWLSSCALAVEPRTEARTQPNVSAPERSVDWNILVLPNCSHGDAAVRKYSGTLALKERPSPSCEKLCRLIRATDKPIRLSTDRAIEAWYHPSIA